MTGLVLLCLARAASPGDPEPGGASAPAEAPPAEAPPTAAPVVAPPTDAPPADAAPDPADPPAPAETTDPAAAFTPPVPLAPLVVTWPADVPADADTAPVSVAVELLVDEAGAVESATVTAGEEPFASAAVAALSAVRFTPATEGGAPVAVYVPVAVEIAPPPINVEGTLRDADGAPVAGVTVTVADRAAVTDADGRFAFRAIAPGDHTLTVADLRFPARPFTLAPDELGRLALFPAAGPVEPGVVGTYRRQRDEVVRRTLTAEEIRTLPGTMGDPLRAIANLPGAVRTPLDAGWLLVRGGDPRDTGVYIDGIRVPLVYHLGGFTSVVHPGFVDRVDFYPGGQSARYGRATAGAVDLVTRPRAESLEVRGGANIVLAGAYAAVPVGEKGSVSAAFRRSYLDGVLNLVPTITEEQARIAPRFWDWQLRGDYGDFSAFGMGYVDTIDSSAAGGERAAITIQTHRLHGRWGGEVFGKPLLVLPYFAYERYDLTIDVLEREQVQQRNGGGARVELADDQDGPFGWTAGFDGSFDWVNLAFLRERAGIARNGRVDSPEVYGDVRIGEARGIRGVVGLRIDTLFVTDHLPRVAPSPRASLTVPIGAHLTLVGDGGVYHQPPPVEMLVGPPEGSTLLLEQSYGGGLGARFVWGPWEAGIDGYARQVPRLTGYESDGSLGQTQGRAAGLETMLKYSGKRVAGWVSYAYARSERRDQAFDTWRPSSYDQPHTAVIVGTVDLGRGWTLGGRWRYASGFALRGEDLIDAYDILLQQSNLLDPEDGRTEPFHSLDLKLSKQARYRKWRLEYYLDVQNLYNRRVPEPVISGVWEAYGTQTYGYGLPVLPILGVEAIVGK